MHTHKLKGCGSQYSCSKQMLFRKVGMAHEKRKMLLASIVAVPYHTLLLISCLMWSNLGQTQIMFKAGLTRITQTKRGPLTRPGFSVDTHTYMDRITSPGIPSVLALLWWCLLCPPPPLGPFLSHPPGQAHILVSWSVWKNEQLVRNICHIISTPLGKKYLSCLFVIVCDWILENHPDGCAWNN